MNDFLVDDYRAAMRAEILKYSEQLSSGKADSYDRYREVVGKIAGLREALDVFKQCMKMRGESEDE